MKMTYSTLRKRFEATGLPSEREIPKGAWFYFDKNLKCWFSTTYSKPEMLSGYADEHARKALALIRKKQGPEPHPIYEL